MIKKSFLTFDLLLLNILLCIVFSIRSIGKIFFFNIYNCFISVIASGICMTFVLFWAAFKYSNTDACCVKVVYVSCSWLLTCV